MKLIGKKLFNFVGLEVRKPLPPQPIFIKQLLDLYQVDAIFDVGANIGQSGAYFRDIGFSYKIVSFEPIEHFYKQLQIKSLNDPHWYVENIALGIESGESEINVSGGHGGASSILEMSDNVISNAPDQRVVRKEKIKVRTLEAMLEKYYPEGERCFLKIDVQGYERMVLEGGLKSLDKVVGLKVEMSLIRNYEGENMLLDMLPFLYSLGFRLVCFENGWSNNTNQEMYQVDGIFFRTAKVLVRVSKD